MVGQEQCPDGIVYLPKHVAAALIWVDPDVDESFKHVAFSVSLAANKADDATHCAGCIAEAVIVHAMEDGTEPAQKVDDLAKRAAAGTRVAAQKPHRVAQNNAGYAKGDALRAATDVTECARGGPCIERRCRGGHKRWRKKAGF